MKNSYLAEKEPIIFDPTPFNAETEKDEITIKINSQGSVECLEEDRASEIPCTDTDNGNVRFITSTNNPFIKNVLRDVNSKQNLSVKNPHSIQFSSYNSVVATPLNVDEFEEVLPNMKQVLQLKKQISLLTQREQSMSGMIRFEFRRQLSEIRNLYRMIRSEADEIESENRITSSHNWKKIKKSLQVAESFCD